jgi:predicted ATPase
MLRYDPEGAWRASAVVVEKSREHSIAIFAAVGALCSAWACAQRGERMPGANELRESLAGYDQNGNKLGAAFFQGLLAEIEAEEPEAQGALARVEDALTRAQQTGDHWTDAVLHRIRGEILLQHDAANTEVAEEAFLTAITIAQEQKAKSLELRAALSLANLYRSTGRAADAYAVLAPALEGFSPTPEFLEIEQAQKLLRTLAESDEVKNATAAR